MTVALPSPYSFPLHVDLAFDGLVWARLKQIGLMETESEVEWRLAQAHSKNATAFREAWQVLLDQKWSFEEAVASPFVQSLSETERRMFAALYLRVYLYSKLSIRIEWQKPIGFDPYNFYSITSSLTAGVINAYFHKHDGIREACAFNVEQLFPQAEQMTFRSAVLLSFRRHVPCPEDMCGPCFRCLPRKPISRTVLLRSDTKATYSFFRFKGYYGFAQFVVARLHGDLPSRFSLPLSTASTRPDPLPNSTAAPSGAGPILVRSLVEVSCGAAWLAQLVQAAVPAIHVLASDVSILTFHRRGGRRTEGR